MRREERVTVQGPVKKQQPDGMSHTGGSGKQGPCPPLSPGVEMDRRPWDRGPGRGCDRPPRERASAAVTPLLPPPPPAQAQYLAIGFTNGVVKILDANTLEEMQSFRTAHDCIIYITFSHDSSLLAIADAENCVGLFRFTHRGQDPRKPVEWVYIGRNRSHRAPVTDIQFGVVPNGTAPRLMSIGEDKRLIEYNLADSEIEAGLRLRSAHKITQGAIPTAFLWHSAPLGDSNTKADSNQDVLVVATNEYKVSSLAAPEKAGGGWRVNRRSTDGSWRATHTTGGGGAPAAAADRKQRPDATCEGRSG